MKIRRLLAVALSAVLGVTAGIVPAAALYKGTEVAHDDALAKAVVQIDSCTGTIIDPHWVLTARHCAFTAQKAHRIRNGLDRPFTESNSKTYTSEAVVWPETGDIALVYVPEYMHLDQYPKVRTTDVDFRASGKVYAWGRETLQRLKYTDVAVGNYSRYPVVYNTDVLQVQYLHGAEGRQGDSGGPLFVDGKVAGVVSFHIDGYNQAFVYFGPVTRTADWIQRTLNTVPEGATPPHNSPNVITPESSSEPVTPDEQPEVDSPPAPETQPPLVPPMPEEPIVPPADPPANSENEAEPSADNPESDASHSGSDISQGNAPANPAPSTPQDDGSVHTPPVGEKPKASEPSAPQEEAPQVAPVPPVVHQPPNVEQPPAKPAPPAVQPPAVHEPPARVEPQQPPAVKPPVAQQPHIPPATQPNVTPPAASESENVVEKPAKETSTWNFLWIALGAILSALGLAGILAQLGLLRTHR